MLSPVVFDNISIIDYFFLSFFWLFPSLPSSSAISSCYSRVYQSLANLIRWSDQVMLEGVNSEDKEMVTTVKDVIKAVLDGVKVREPSYGKHTVSVF